MNLYSRSIVYGAAVFGSAAVAALCQVVVMDGRLVALEPYGLLVYVAVVGLGIGLGPSATPLHSTEPVSVFEHSGFRSSWTVEESIGLTPQVLALSSFLVVVLGSLRFAFMGGGTDWSTGWLWIQGWCVLWCVGFFTWRRTRWEGRRVSLDVGLDEVELQVGRTVVVHPIRHLRVEWEDGRLRLGDALDAKSVPLSPSPAALEVVGLLRERSRATTEPMQVAVPAGLERLIPLRGSDEGVAR